MRYGSQLSLSVAKQVSRKQGGTKGGTKLKRNSVEARRRAKRGGKNCKRRNTKAQCGHAATDQTAILARRDKESWMFILIYALSETADK